MKKICTLIFALMILTSGMAQKKDLILKLEAGKEYKQVTSSKATINQNINGQQMDMVITIKGSMSYLVKAANEKDYDMDVKYEKLSMNIQLPETTLEYNSEKNDEQDILSSILGEMKNKPFQVKMAQNGKISEVKNIDSLWESAINKFNQLPEGQAKQMKTQLMNAYGEKAFKGNIEMVTAIFPSEPVSEGDVWTINTKLEAGMSGDVTTNYKFVERNNDYILITGDSKIATADKDAYIESNGMPMKFDLSGTIASEIKIDKTSGWIIDAKINQEIKGDVYLKENPQMPDGMKIPMTMKNEMTITNN